MIRKSFLMAAVLTAAISVSAQELYLKPAQATTGWSSFENLNGVKNAGGQRNKEAKGAAFASVKAGETKVLLDVKGTGIIQRIWCTIRNREPKMLRSLRLQMFWDGDAKPAVDVPLGDFFVANTGKTVAFQSALFASPEGRSYNCFIPMPFRKGARVLLINEGTEDQKMLYFDIDFIRVPSLSANAQYFHAFWNRQANNPLKKDYEILPGLKGNGRFLGVSVGVFANKEYGNTWWGEGEVKMYIDGDNKYPTINGTGTEDYIGTGWGLSAFSNWYQGCPVASDSLKTYGFYRWHLPDAVYFKNEISVRLQEIGGGEDTEVKAAFLKGLPVIPISVDGENGYTNLFELKKLPAITDADFPKGWVNFYRVDDYSSVAYFYLQTSSSNLPTLAPLAERIAGIK